MEIKLNSLSLLRFNKDNINHVKFLKMIIKDEKIKKYVKGISSGLLHNSNDFFDSGYIVALDDELIGYLYVGLYNYEESSVYLRSAISEEHRGKGYGKLLLNEVTGYIFDNYDLNYIKANINPNNKYSKRMAIASNFKYEGNEIYYIEKNKQSLR